MTKQSALMTFKKSSAIIQAAVLATAAFLPVVLLGGNASGAQLDNRFIDISGSGVAEGSGRSGSTAAGQDVTYTVGFDIGTTGNVGGLVIDFCSDSPIVGDVCTAPTGFNLNFATLAIANQAGITDFSIDTTNSSASQLVLTRSAASVSATTSVEFDLGTSATGDGITNPTTVGTFYARIVTYATDTAAQAYDSETPGTFVDEGGIALAIANELTITARVQEVLEFCIGTQEDSTLTPAGDPLEDCSNVAGTDIDLGVVDSNSISNSTTEGNSGVAMIRTNAANGAVVYYKAEQDTNSGQLKIAGESCISPSSTEDACFNSAGLTQVAFTAGVERFGMALRNLNNDYGGATSNLACNVEYRSNTTCADVAPGGYAWRDDGQFATIASSTSVLDDEMVNLEFAATAAPTTPTGLYTVTANFVATSTF